jgi:hypothetical protein
MSKRCASGSASAGWQGKEPDGRNYVAQIWGRVLQSKTAALVRARRSFLLVLCSFLTPLGCRGMAFGGTD